MVVRARIDGVMRRVGEVPKVYCREPYAPTPAELSAESADGIILETETLYRARGCPECASTGYAGGPPRSRAG